MRIVLVLLLFSKTALLAQPGSITIINGDLQVIHNSRLQLIYFPIGIFKNLEWQPGFAYYQDGSSRPYQGIRLNLREDRTELKTNS